LNERVREEVDQPGLTRRRARAICLCRDISRIFGYDRLVRLHQPLPHDANRSRPTDWPSS
jgi:hypothetical protein